MQSDRLIDSLERFGNALSHLVADLDAEDARWRPPDEAWSIVEIVRHLGDEEVDDFRARLESTLRDRTAEWPGIDPEGWSTERNYRDADLDAAVERFVRERRHSIVWLRKLDAPDFALAYDHPKFGPIRAGDLLTAWAAHDALHTRQIAKRLYQLADRNGAAYSTEYAGGW